MNYAELHREWSSTVVFYPIFEYICFTLNFGDIFRLSHGAKNIRHPIQKKPQTLNNNQNQNEMPDIPTSC